MKLRTITSLLLVASALSLVSISWADLFLALFYSATVVLFVAWIRNCELPNLPQPLENLVGKFASCTATRNGNHRSVDRPISSDHNVCHFDGTVVGDLIDGTYTCKFGMLGGVATWKAKIITETEFDF